MIRIPRSVRVALAGATAVATIAAGGSVLLATSASAANPGVATRLRIQPIYPTDNIASAGTCMIYRLMPTDDFGQDATDSGTVVITLQESPNTGSQDLDFCLTPSPAPDGLSGVKVDHGTYTNSPQPTGPTGGTSQSYCAGESITPPAANTCSQSTNNPDTASNDTLSPTNPAPGTNTNPSGKDSVNDVGYTNAVPNRRFVEFGVVGLTPGSGGTIDACIDRNSNGNCTSGTGVQDVQAATVAVSFTAGGQPDSSAAYNAVTTITSDRTSYQAVQSPNTPAPIDLSLVNSSSDTVFGVIPNYRVQSGPNLSSTIRSCPRSNDFGESVCNYLGAQPGTDTLLVWVNHSGGAATAGPDPGEPTQTITVTTYAQPAAAATAKTIDLTPNTPTSTTATQPKVFTATVLDATGAPVQGAQVTFSESGPGQISGGTSPDGLSSSKVVGTGPDGRASITITTVPGEAGSETVTASISATDTQCATTGGTCSDSTTNTVGGGPSPTPTPSSTKSPTPTPTGSGTRRALSLRTSTPDIQPTNTGVLDVTGQPNATVELRCYTRPSSAYGTARGPQALSSTGSWQFQITPGANTRCYVRYTGDEASASNSVVINVHTTLSLSAYRDGVRKYHFQGTNLPRRSGQLITLYRWSRRDNNGYCDPQIAAGDYSATSSDPNCVAVRTATATTNASNVWRIDRSFTGSGQFVFQVRTSQNLTNGAGVSNARLTIIH
ncbi:MAG: hypothetical protein JWP11_3118 [Frankiales bacterium]|nr:hypothetical protein [Frankiales bacterium]